MSPNDTFSEGAKRKGGNKKEAALAALLAQPTAKAAAQSCGISYRQLLRWLAEPEFAERFSQAKLELVSATGARLRANGVAAAEALREVAANPMNPPGAGARVAAARGTLEFMFKSVETEEILERLEKLEQDRGGDIG
jgi:hypothetical protein